MLCSVCVCVCFLELRLLLIDGLLAGGRLSNRQTTANTNQGDKRRVATRPTGYFKILSLIELLKIRLAFLEERHHRLAGFWL